MPNQTTYNIDPAAMIEGQLIDAGSVRAGDVKTMYNGEASAKILFGLAVKWGSATDGKNAKLPAAETDNLVGVVLHSHSYETGPAGDLDPTPVTGGVRPTGKLNVLRRGTVAVKVRTGCAPGQRGWVRAVSGGGLEVVGGFENADDGTDMIDATTQVEFLTFTAAGGIAKAAVDFINK